MTFTATVLPEFDQEMASTRKALERVPSDKATWKPHPKSFALGHLAQLIASMPGWIVNMATKTELDLAASPGYSFESTDSALDSLSPDSSTSTCSTLPSFAMIA